MLSASARRMLNGAIADGIVRRRELRGELPPAQWSPLQTELIIHACSELTLDTWFERALAEGFTGELLASLQTLGARGLFTLEADEPRPTNIAYAEAMELEAAQRLARERSA